MRTPEEALSAARRQAAADPWEPDDDRESGRPSDIEFVQPFALERLASWALIEPEAAEVYSTRRVGRPITWVKRAILRLTRQYVDQIAAQQSRFNAMVVAQVLALDDRVRLLERHVQSRREQSGTDNGARGE